MFELFKLIKMLFSSKPSDFKEPELFPMKHYPFKGYRFMMWCGRMIYRIDNQQRIDEYISSDRYPVSLNHETIHLRQAQLSGSWFKFYWVYFVQWLKGNPLSHPSSSAYYTIPYEMEAYANEDNLAYTSNYTGENLKHYTIKKRKSTYHSKGNSREWKAFLKTIEIK